MRPSKDLPVCIDLTVFPLSEESRSRKVEGVINGAPYIRGDNARVDEWVDNLVSPIVNPFSRLKDYCPINYSKPINITLNLSLKKRGRKND